MRRGCYRPYFEYFNRIGISFAEDFVVNILFSSELPENRKHARKMNIIAIIPARGGSKRIPRKNLFILAGKPLVAYSIANAMDTPSVQRTFVSTDDEEISETARRYGAEVIQRPPQISTDTAPSESALAHALNYLENTERYEPDLVVFLQVTSPLRRANDIQNAIDTLMGEDADSLFSACPIEGFIWRTSPELSPVNYDPGRRPRRQELKAHMWEENGSIYVFKPWVLREYNSRLGGTIAMYPMGRLESYQVDELEDLELMEKILKLPQKHEDTKIKDEGGHEGTKAPRK